MNKYQHRLGYAFGVLLLILCYVECAYAQPPAGSTPAQPGGQRQRPGQSADTFDRRSVENAIEQPFNSVLVRIRFKKEFGYKSEASEGGPGVSSCDAFSVSLAKPARPSVANVLIPVRRPDKITEQYGYYFCEFFVTGLALDQDVTIGASVNDQGPWLNGDQSQVPANYQRALTDRERTVTLTQSDPRATMNFEVIYEPKGDFVQPKRSDRSIYTRP